MTQFNRELRSCYVYFIDLFTSALVEHVITSAVSRTVAATFILHLNPNVPIKDV